MIYFHLKLKTILTRTFLVSFLYIICGKLALLGMQWLQFSTWFDYLHLSSLGYILQTLPVFTFANQAGLDMLETTLAALQEITLEKIFDDHGRKSLNSEFPQIMQQVSCFNLFMFIQECTKRYTLGIFNLIYWTDMLNTAIMNDTKNTYTVNIICLMC